MQKKAQAAVQAAYKAGDLLRNRFRSNFKIREEAPANLVTELDIQAEKIILDILCLEYPGIPALTEEGLAISNESPKERWIIDPLDGTTNYAHGYPCFAVSIALEHYGQIKVGVVYDPMMDQMYTAIQGQGAFVNGEPIRVSHTRTLSKSLIGSGFPYYAWTNTNNNSSEWAALIKRVVSLRCDGSAALDLCRVASGSLDGFWELDLEAWDMAAGALIVLEAGGLVTRVEGSPFTPFQRSLLATNGSIHAELLDVLMASFSDDH